MSVSTLSKPPTPYTDSIEGDRVRDIAPAGRAVGATYRRARSTLCCIGYPNQCVDEPVEDACDGDTAVSCQFYNTVSWLAELRAEVAG